MRTVEAAMYEDNHKVYTMFRNEFAEKIEDLEKDRARILRRKKNKKEKMKLLKANSKQKLFYMLTALNNTIKHFKKLYFENDYYRQKNIMEQVSSLSLFCLRPLIFLFRMMSTRTTTRRDLRTN